MTRSATASEPAPRPRWGLFASVLVVWVALDQATKFLALGAFTNVFQRLHADTLAERLAAFATARPPGPVAHPPTVVVPAFWNFFYTENIGAFGSLGSRLPEAVRVPAFTLVSLVAIVLMAEYHRRVASSRPALAWALPLLCGGAAGNALDRVLRGYVIDFVDWHLADPAWQAPVRHWFTFNVADVGITVGVCLVLLDGVLAARAEKRSKGT